MKQKIQLQAMMVLLIASSQAQAARHSLEIDYGVRGVLHYCKYTNGKVYSFDASEACPASIADQPSSNGRGMGYLKGESNEGSAKLCIYNVSGTERTSRMDVNSNCPLNQEF